MTKANDELSIKALRDLIPDRLNTVISPYLAIIPSSTLKEAMTYALANPGKRLRAQLIYATGRMLGADWEILDLPAVAVELIHTYSLIHDDLPCMDNAALRRGKPTCHQVFSEGMAMLTGDALHTLAMQILASHPASIDSIQRLKMLQILTQACGPHGMAAGQALDLNLSNQSDSTMLLTINSLKTGALFSAAIELGRLSSNHDNSQEEKILKTLGEKLGLAFQIQDDILDITMSTEILGKPQHNDEINTKQTYPHHFGLEKSQAYVTELYHSVNDSLQHFGVQGTLLKQLVHAMATRLY